MKRDFTYVDDIVEANYRCYFKTSNINLNFDALNPDHQTSFAPYRIFNIGNSKPIEILKLFLLFRGYFRC
tara:strand:- start:34 stop:243 length:210 start_codon:yes stop_codon:yes gene_type:complete